MRVADLIDLEWQLHQDEESARAGRYEEVLRRDRALGIELLGELGVDPQEARPRLASERSFREDLDLAWLERVARGCADGVLDDLGFADDDLRGAGGSGHGEPPICKCGCSRF